SSWLFGCPGKPLREKRLRAANESDTMFTRGAGLRPANPGGADKDGVMKRNLWIGVTTIGVVAALAIASSYFEKRSVVEAAGTQAPRFEVDPMWPKPLPNHWIMGNVIGVSVDEKDHVWIIHR